MSLFGQQPDDNIFTPIDPVEIPDKILPRIPDPNPETGPDAKNPQQSSSQPDQPQSSSSQPAQQLAGGGEVINIQNISYQGGGDVNKDSGITITGMGPDTQLIAAQPGEIVMSKKAVDAYGADTLLSMNKEAGGTNIPKFGKIQGFQGGGQVGPQSSTGESNVRALLKTIRYAEGTSGPDGYNTWFGGRTDMDLTSMTINEVVVEQKRRLRNGEATYGRYTSAAVGAYQMMEPEKSAAAIGLDPATTKFTPEVQDRISVDYYMKKQAKMSQAEIEAPISKKQIAKMSGVWASLPNAVGDSAYDQPVKDYQKLQEVYYKNLQTTPTQVPPASLVPPAPESTTPNNKSVGDNLNDKSGGSVITTSKEAHDEFKKLKPGSGDKISVPGVGSIVAGRSIFQTPMVKYFNKNGEQVTKFEWEKGFKKVNPTTPHQHQ